MLAVFFATSFLNPRIVYIVSGRLNPTYYNHHGATTIMILFLTISVSLHQLNLYLVICQFILFRLFDLVTICGYWNEHLLQTVDENVN